MKFLTQLRDKLQENIYAWISTNSKKLLKGKVIHHFLEN